METSIGQLLDVIDCYSVLLEDFQRTEGNARLENMEKVTRSGSSNDGKNIIMSEMKIINNKEGRVLLGKNNYCVKVNFRQQMMIGPTAPPSCTDWIKGIIIHP